MPGSNTEAVNGLLQSDDALSRKYSDKELRGLNPGSSEEAPGTLSHVPDLLTSPTKSTALKVDVAPTTTAAERQMKKAPVALSIERNPSPPPPPLGKELSSMTPAEQSASTLAEIQAALIDADSPRYSQAVNRVQAALLKLITENGAELSEPVVMQVAQVIYNAVISISQSAALADVVKETLMQTKHIALKWGQALHAAILDRCQQSFERRALFATENNKQFEFLNLAGFLGELFNRGYATLCN